MKKVLAYLLAITLLTVILETCAAEAASEWKYDTLWGYLSGYSGSGGDVAVHLWDEDLRLVGRQKPDSGEASPDAADDRRFLFLSL